MLDVGGMSCGGCSAAVKRILTASKLDGNSSAVEGASVNLLTSTAVVRFRGALSPCEATAAAEAAAALLTKKGFPSAARGDAEGDVNAAAQASDLARQRELARASVDLAVAWGLALVCCAHHAGHWLHAAGIHSMAHGPVAEALSKPLVAGILGAAALAGPGRPVLSDGAAALFKRGSPNMNSLVALGSVASFTAGALGPTLFPSLGFGASFMEEPVMLLAFVLLGRAAEARARLEAGADLRALAGLVPSDARLVLDPGLAPGAATGNGEASAPSSSSLSPLAETALVRTAAVAVGDVVRVLPGERVPVDGVVISDSNSSSADEALLTGESALVQKREGDAIAAGAVVYGSPLDVRATATGGDCAVARMAALVKDAQSREAPSQRLADAVSGKFCYGVMGIAAATALFWGSGLGLGLVPGAAAAAGVAAAAVAPPSAASASLSLAAKLAIDVLVVACPCALGLAAPTAVLVASSAGARRGLLLRGGGATLEALAAVDAVVFDKTGTLTRGKPELVASSVFPLGQGGGRDGGLPLMLAAAAAAEAGTLHPIASAVRSAAAEAGVLRAEDSSSAAAASSGLEVPLLGSAVAECLTAAGDGSRATLVDGRVAAVGRRRWVEEQVGALSSGEEEEASTSSSSPSSSSSSSFSGEDAATATGATTIFVGLSGPGILGTLTFRDALRPDAAATVAALQSGSLGIRRVLLLSGDAPAAVARVAAAVGIAPENAVSRARPEDKVAAVRSLREQGYVVAMVGDGVNDAPALAAANVGMALVAAGPSNSSNSSWTSTSFSSNSSSTFAKGTDAAGDAADVVLLGDRLSQVPEALELGRGTLAKIRANLGWALFYNAAALPLAAGAALALPWLPGGGFALDPSVAGGMMAFSSVAVVCNSLLLRPAFARKVEQLARELGEKRGEEGGLGELPPARSSFPSSSSSSSTPL